MSIGGQGAYVAFTVSRKGTDMVRYPFVDERNSVPRHFAAFS